MLVTCFPFEFIGNAPIRFIVRAIPKAQFARREGSVEPTGSEGKSDAIR
jgi:hypothetical protein